MNSIKFIGLLSVLLLSIGIHNASAKRGKVLAVCQGKDENVKLIATCSEGRLKCEGSENGGTGTLACSKGGKLLQVQSTEATACGANPPCKKTVAASKAQSANLASSGTARQTVTNSTSSGGSNLTATPASNTGTGTTGNIAADVAASSTNSSADNTGSNTGASTGSSTSPLLAGLTQGDGGARGFLKLTSAKH